MHIPIIEFTSPKFEELDKGADFIDSALSKNKKIYIHCREGISRAPCFIVAYLIKHKKNNLEEAIVKVRETRCFIKILGNQKKALRLFEKKIKK